MPDPSISLAVFAPGADPATDDPKATIVAASDRRWLTQLDDTGAGSFVIADSDSDVLVIEDDDYVVCYLDEEPVFGWIVEDTARHKIDQSEEAGQVRTISGRGRASIMDRAIVFPTYGINRRMPDTRVFDYTSPLYWAAEDLSDWWNPSLTWSVSSQVWAPAEVVQTGNGLGGGPAPWSGFPDGLNSDDLDYGIYGARWIHTTAGQLGHTFYYREYTVPATPHIGFPGPYTGPGRYYIYITGDDAYELIIDGVSIGSENAVDVPALWEEVKKYEIELDAGPHSFGIHAYNGAGPGGVIMSMHKAYRDTTDDHNRAALTTNEDWSATSALNPPAMTPGKIVRLLRDEATARGVLTLDDGVSLAFNDQIDTNGNPWPRISLSLTVGTTLLDVLRQLSELGVDWEMNPSYNTLYMYNFLGNNAPVSFTAGVNIGSLDDHSTSTDLTNAILTRAKTSGSDELAWLEVVNSPSVTKYRRRESFLSAGDQQADYVRAVANAFMAEKAAPLIELSIEAVPRPDLADPARARPYVDFNVGDWVSAPQTVNSVYTGRVERPTSFRVRAISVAEDVDGNLTINPELGSLITETTHRIQNWLKTMVPGALGGTTWGASPTR